MRLAHAAAAGTVAVIFRCGRYDYNFVAEIKEAMQDASIAGAIIVSCDDSTQIPLAGVKGIERHEVLAIPVVVISYRDGDWPPALHGALLS